MEHSSRKESYQRKRTHSKRRNKRRLAASAFVVAFVALAAVLWFTYKGDDGAERTAADAAQTETGAGGASAPGAQSQSQTQSGPSGGSAGQSQTGAPNAPGGGAKGSAEPDGPSGSAASPNGPGASGAAGSPTGDAGGVPDSGPNGGAAVPAGGSPGSGSSGAPSGSDKPGRAGTTGPSGGNGAVSVGAPGGSPIVISGGGLPDTPDRVRLTFVGDVMFADNAGVALKANGYDYPYRNVQPYLEDADLTIANLETPITERGEPQSKEYAYRSSPLALPAFKESGVDLVNLANNHILDYGTVGLLDTFDHLDKIGIGRFGAGHNAAEAFKPVIVEKKGIKIAFLGLSKVVPTQEWKAGRDTPGVADTYALKAPLEAIGKAKEQADLVVVVTHWGLEQHDDPEPYQRDFARQYIDAGADLIVGGHPHVLQGFESYKGKWIAYSLGNFIFTMNENPKTWETVILQASCSKEGGCELKAVPVLTKLANPLPMDQTAAAKLFARLTGISFQAKIGNDGTVLAK